MNRLALILSTLLSVILFDSCGHKTPPPAPGSSTGYAISFFKSVNSVSEKGANVVVSPYSAGVALSMLAEGADGETKVEFDNALNGCIFGKDTLAYGGNVIISSANSVWINNDFSVRNHYVNLLQKDYDALAVTLDFSDPATLHAINNWCSEHTEGKIINVLGKLPPSMAMVLVNALYFAADWEKQFNEDLTAKDTFYGVDGETDVDMMYIEGRFNYIEYQGYQVIELPYSGGNCSMFVALPPEGMDIDKAISSLSDSILDSALNMFEPVSVKFKMPKIKLEASMSLNRTLEGMGVRTAFSSAADFSGISASGPLSLSEVVQKCYVDISEKGTEAAAVTVAMVNLTAVRPQPQNKHMIVNRPYVFFIADKDLKNILFAGKIVSVASGNGN